MSHLRVSSAGLLARVSGKCVMGIIAVTRENCRLPFPGGRSTISRRRSERVYTTPTRARAARHIRTQWKHGFSLRTLTNAITYTSSAVVWRSYVSMTTSTVTTGVFFSYGRPYVIGQTIIFSSCVLFFLFLLLFPRLISAAADWMSTILPHMVWP